MHTPTILTPLCWPSLTNEGLVRAVIFTILVSWHSSGIRSPGRGFWGIYGYDAFGLLSSVMIKTLSSEVKPLPCLSLEATGFGAGVSKNALA